VPPTASTSTFALEAAPMLHQIRMTVGPRFLARLTELKDALSHTHPEGRLEDLLLHAMEVTLKDHRKRQPAEVEQPRPPRTRKPKGRTIPASVGKGVTSLVEESRQDRGRSTVKALLDASVKLAAAYSLASSGHNKAGYYGAVAQLDKVKQEAELLVDTCYAVAQQPGQTKEVIYQLASAASRAQHILTDPGRYLSLGERAWSDKEARYFRGEALRATALLGSLNDKYFRLAETAPDK
jgi:hypothetical protein